VENRWMNCGNRGTLYFQIPTFEKVFSMHKSSVMSGVTLFGWGGRSTPKRSIALVA
jgi:hypothetical protein